MADLGFLACGYDDSRPDRTRRPAHAVLGHPRPWRRQTGAGVSERPRAARGRHVVVARRRDGAPSVHVEVRGQGRGHHRARGAAGPHADLRAHQARCRPAGDAAGPRWRPCRCDSRQLKQNARQRALDGFAAGHPRVLVATDVAARGIHVDDVDLVVHFDPPNDSKDYLHRSGRTARAGASGTALSFVQPGEVRDVAALHKSAGVVAGLGRRASRPSGGPRARRVRRAGRRPGHAHVATPRPRHALGRYARKSAPPPRYGASRIQGPGRRPRAAVVGRRPPRCQRRSAAAPALSVGAAP